MINVRLMDSDADINTSNLCFWNNLYENNFLNRNAAEG